MIGMKAILGMALLVSVLGPRAFAQGPDEQRLVELTNEARAEGGQKPVVWDDALAEAARIHAELMSKEAEISHRYTGELDLPERAAKVGAHFSTIAEQSSRMATTSSAFGRGTSATTGEGIAMVVDFKPSSPFAVTRNQ